LRELGRYRESLEYLDQSITQDPSNSFAISQRAKVLGEFPLGENNTLQKVIQCSADSLAKLLESITLGEWDDSMFYQKQLNEWTKEVINVAKRSVVTNQDVEFEWRNFKKDST